jgi:ribonuclease Z
MRAWVLGSGVPTPSATRASSGYLVEIDGSYLVFDHGFGAFQRLLELGVDPVAVTQLFFTHLHYDHVGDFARLVLTRWDQGAGRVADLEVFGPPPLARTAERLFAEDGVYGPDSIARTRNQSSLDLYRLRGGTGERARPNPSVRELLPGESVSGADWRVRVAEVEHFRPLLTCYAYRIEHAGRSLVYSGDTGPCDALVELAQDCDVLIHMCHYISGTAMSDAFASSSSGHKEAAEIARRARAKTLVLTHITAQIDQPGIRERVIADVARIFGGNVVLAQDLLPLPIEGVAGSRLD